MIQKELKCINLFQRMPIKNCFLLPEYQSLCDVTVSQVGLRMLCSDRIGPFIAQSESALNKAGCHNRVNLELEPS